MDIAKLAGVAFFPNNTEVPYHTLTADASWNPVGILLAVASDSRHENLQCLNIVRDNMSAGRYGWDLTCVYFKNNLGNNILSIK